MKKQGAPLLFVTFSQTFKKRKNFIDVFAFSVTI